MNKRIKITLILFLIFALGIIVYFFLPSATPEKEVYLSDNISVWRNQFTTTQENNWNVKENKIFFFDSTGSIGRLTLFTDEIPSENKKPKRLTASVVISGDFNEKSEDIFYGFELGNKGATDRNKIIFGVNGLGQFTALNGRGKELENLTFDENYDMNKDHIGLCTEEVNLTFTLIGNPYGWIIYYEIHGNGDQTTCRYKNFINRIPDSLFSDDVRELSLVAFNPIQNDLVWFRDLKIQNDWTPND